MGDMAVVLSVAEWNESESRSWGREAGKSRKKKKKKLFDWCNGGLDL